MDNKKKKTAIIICLVIIATIVIISLAVKPRGTGDGITRYEWIEMLSETFGMAEYVSEEPLVPDVDQNNTYYSSVQASCEWGIIDKGIAFEGDKTADGKFVALTAMKAIGKYKVQLYLGTAEEPGEEDYSVFFRLQ